MSHRIVHPSPDLPFIPPASRPWVMVTMAMSADAKIASANRRITRIGSDRDLEGLYALRSTADAILCGARTVEESHATLGNGGEHHRISRLRRGLGDHPLRIVATRSGTLSPRAEIWAHRFSAILILTTRRAPLVRRKALHRLADAMWVSAGNEVDFDASLRRLHREYAIRRLLVEGGGELNDALFRTGLVDELHLTVCPLILGGGRAPTLADGCGVAHLSVAPRMMLVASRRIGNELHTIFRRAPSDSSAATPDLR